MYYFIVTKRQQDYFKHSQPLVQLLIKDKKSLQTYKPNEQMTLSYEHGKKETINMLLTYYSWINNMQHEEGFKFKPRSLHTWMQLSVLFQKPVSSQKNI